MNQRIPASIAVVGDDVRSLRNIERVFTDDGIAVHLLTTPALDTAAELIAGLRPDAVLTELYLYDAPAGLLLAERLRAQRPTRRTPIFVTCREQRELARRWGALESHGCRALPQPISDAALLAAIRAAEPWTPPVRSSGGALIPAPAPSYAYYGHEPAVSRVMHAFTRLVSHR